MTGDEHYEQAESILANAEAEDNWQVKQVYAGIALTHATLAQAAATAVAGQLEGYGQQT